MALIRANVLLSIQPRRWKVAWGVTIPKPGKDDYGLAKSYRVISLLNCLGKMVEKVAAMMVSAHCEAMGRSHPGQYGCRARRSAVDAVTITIAHTQEAWRHRRITGALLMGVAAAFPSVARGCLLRKMRAMDIDECLVSWTNSFMRDRQDVQYLVVEPTIQRGFERARNVPWRAPRRLEQVPFVKGRVFFRG